MQVEIHSAKRNKDDRSKGKTFRVQSKVNRVSEHKEGLEVTGFDCSLLDRWNEAIMGRDLTILLDRQDLQRILDKAIEKGIVELTEGQFLMLGRSYFEKALSRQ